METASNIVGGLWKKKPEPPFPPPEWGIDGAPHSDPDAAARVPLPTAPAVEHDLSAHAASDAPDSPTPDGAHTPATLARRIRALFPAGAPPSDGKAPALPPLSDPVTADAPPPEPPVPEEVESGLARLLRTPSVMNGSLAQGTRSVWDALERLRAPKTRSSADANADKGKAKAEPSGDSAEESGGENDDDDDDSVMFSAPLIPNNDSRLELAERERVRTDASGRIIGVLRDEPAHSVTQADTTAAKGQGADLSRRKSWWPFGQTHGVGMQQPSPTKPEATAAVPAAASAPSAEAPKAEPAPAKEGLIDTLKRRVSQRYQERMVWVPSSENISLQASWWGYRIYLPPPVLNVLDNKSIEATKRAAMLTTALQWLLAKIPLAAVPPQMKPGVMIAKRLVPYVGYVGAAIAWSWSAIRGYDKGHGVVLSATWLLPVAVVPSTWDGNPFAEAPKTGPSPKATNESQASSSIASAFAPEAAV